MFKKWCLHETLTSDVKRWNTLGCLDHYMTPNVKWLEVRAPHCHAPDHTHTHINVAAKIVGPRNCHTMKLWQSSRGHSIWKINGDLNIAKMYFCSKSGNPNWWWVNPWTFSNWVNFYFNSLRPSDTIWRHRSESTLAQIMACCLAAPSHYLSQGWLVISKILWHSPEFNFTVSCIGLHLFNDDTRPQRHINCLPQVGFSQLFMLYKQITGVQWC